MNLLLIIVILGITEPQTNYQKTEIFFVESTKNIENEEFYLKAKFFDEEKNEETTFRSLTETEKDHYYLLRAERLSAQMEKIQTKLAQSNEEEALLFSVRLLNLRKDFANKQENLIQRKSEKYPDLKIYLEEIKQTNKQKKLTK